MRAIKFPSLPNLSLPNLSLPNIDLTKVDLSKVATKFRLNEINAEPVIQFVKDAAYVTIGVGVLTFQKSQVRRREITTAVKEAMPKITSQAIIQAESAVSKVVALVESRLPRKSTPVAE
ncbi:MAG: hypothetical protein WC864_01935 [Ilumatobacteraceae bacterium]